MRLRVRGGRAVRGEAVVPGDKSIGHRAVLLAAIADGPSRIRRLSGGEDNARTVEAMRALGVRVEAPAAGVLDVEGVGLEGLRGAGAASGSGSGPGPGTALPPLEIFCGNSGTTMRLLAGLLAARPFEVRLDGDASLRRRPMGRVAAPLRAMGGRVDAAATTVAPLVLGGVEAPACGGWFALPVASAQVKSAILICGLRAPDDVVVEEPAPTRDHTERMLAAMGAPLRSVPGRASLDAAAWGPRAARRLHALDRDVPADLSAAVFPLAVALLVPGSEVAARGVTVQPARAGALEALAAMGAAFTRGAERDAGGEPVADLHAACPAGAAPGLRATRVDGARLAAAIDEVPVLAALAAVAEGDTVFADAAELRVKETDRIATTAAMLRAFGARADERPDGLVVHGAAGIAALHPARVDAAGDHRIAMAAAVLGAALPGETVIDGAGGVATSFPGFAAALAALGADIDEEPS
ncbi:MAG TPA: 3-phosphoshikimate 1-carboxyvinyltransferase [Myxococcota bacterium]|jgi:3-phosphoshikimate 1-carboxyvinyltransferase|nr:3-phosphoshikimate 1-carboxyvinyltransferase [Myxococcota bacterium]